MVVEVIMTFPFLTAMEENRRDSVVTLAHDEVCKPGNLINDGLFRDLQYVAEEVCITPEIAYCGHTAPADRVAGLSTPKCPSNRIGNDDPYIAAVESLDPFSHLFCGLH